MVIIDDRIWPDIIKVYLHILIIDTLPRNGSITAPRVERQNYIPTSELWCSDGVLGHQTIVADGLEILKS